MKVRVLLLMLLFMLTLQCVNASDKVHVSIKEEFSTLNPKDNLDFVVIEDSLVGENELKAEDILHCEVISVSKPKRGKRPASFSIRPISYTNLQGQTVQFKGDYSGKYASKVFSKEELKNIDKKKVGKKAVVTAGNYFVKGVSSAVSLAEGVIKNEDGNRVKSGIKQVYKDSPISYIEKGDELDLKEGESFYLIFKDNENNEIEEAEESSISE